MGKGLLFFCCSCCILALAIINLNVGPIVSGAFDSAKGTLNCKKYKDDKDDAYGKKGIRFTYQFDNYYQSKIDWCTRLKGMHDMEYSAFIFDKAIGFICGLLGLLHLFDFKKDFVSNTGFIGLICGVVGFVLTFVYVIFNGIVFTSKYSDVLERDEDGFFAELEDLTGIPDTGVTATYKCIFFDDSGDSYSGIAKISELNKKQYNYIHDIYKEPLLCKDNGNYESYCKGSNIGFYGIFTVTYNSGSDSLYPFNCPKILAKEIDDFTNKDKYDRFLTVLILSLIVCLANIGLALFGFLLFRTPGDF